MEKDIESYLRKRVKAAGGLALKLVCPGCTGVPDRLILLPGGRAYFAETKDTGELALQRVRTLMENLEPGLAPCPFCGARAVVRGIFRYASPGAMVECPRCHCGTPALIPGHDYLTGESETLERTA